MADLRALHLGKLETKFSAFLASSKRLTFSSSELPRVSIILVLYNKAEFTFACLELLYVSLVDGKFPYEIIAVDNGSSDPTRDLLDRCDNLTVIKNSSNLGYLHGVNAASERARGDYLLFLNNDTEVLIGSIEKACDVLSADGGVGAVGARLILPDGTLQEAGSIVWQDGSCLGYCRGCDPNHYEANFRREVDYCSAAFLMTRTPLFHRLGRFNPTYEPAYYEDTDYCLRLWENGFRVVYDPSTIAFHFEFASSGDDDAVVLQQTNQKKFKAAHHAALASHYPPDRRKLLHARHAGPRKLCLLFVDDRVPHAHLGSGFPRARRMIDEFVALGAQVTLCPTNEQFHAWNKVRQTLHPSVEVAFGVPRDQLVKFMRLRRGYYDAILISRPHNMAPINDAIEADRGFLDGCPLIYDAEALITNREIALRRLTGENVGEDERKRLMADEAKLTRFATTVLCVSQNEQRQMRDFHRDVRVLGHAVATVPTTAPFEKRKDMLFIGAVHPGSPNEDSLTWFIDNILPLLRSKIPQSFRFMIAGLNDSDAVKQRLGDGVVGLGPVDDLAPLYLGSRIFVAPTRFAAGIPRKVHDAASQGLPCVVTPLLAEQLSWCEGKEVLVGADVEFFRRRLRQALYRSRALVPYSRCRD